VRFLMRKERLDWVVSMPHEDGTCFVEAWSRSESHRPAAIFGPYETQERAENVAIMNRALLPTRESLRLLKRPGWYERAVLSFVPRDKREEVKGWARYYKKQRDLEKHDE
jgi:hypothetical protein